MKSIIIILLIACLFVVIDQGQAWCQTSIEGRVLSVDGRTIPSTAISIRVENPKDIFNSYSKDIIPDEDGSYEFFISEPGLYRITFRGVFHQEIRIPVMIYDQPSMRMNVLLIPMHFNNGYYFDEGNYLQWIRVVGNFNDYDYHTGKQFSLNSDGSISAFIPVDSDTIRYHVRGLTYNQGVTALPQADEFHFQENLGFESVLFNNLPEDSLEIHYDPNRTIPFKRHFPIGIDPVQVNLSGFISLENQEDENWIRPLGLLQPFTKAYNFVRWEMSKGIPIEPQIELQQKYAGDIFDIDLKEELERVSRNLSKDNLHPQQKALLSMSYASILGWMARKTLFQQMRNEHELLKKSQSESQVPEIKPDKEIINSIPEIVPAVHPAWRYNNGAVDYLLTETNDPQKFVNYFYDVVKYHPDDRAVRLIAPSIIRHFGSEYSSVEEMSVYRIILERYGENDLARDAHRAFEVSHLDDSE